MSCEGFVLGSGAVLKSSAVLEGYSNFTLQPVFFPPSSVLPERFSIFNLELTLCEKFGP